MPEPDRFDEVVEMLRRMDSKLDASILLLRTMNEAVPERELKSLLREALEIQSLRVAIKDLDERLRKLEK